MNVLHVQSKSVITSKATSLFFQFMKWLLPVACMLCVLLMNTNAGHAKNDRKKKPSKEEVLNAIFKAPINQAFIAKMLPLVASDPLEAPGKVPAKGGGIGMQKKWGCLYVPQETFKQYVRLKSTLMKRAEALSKEEAARKGIQNKIKETIEISQSVSRNRDVTLGRMLARMTDPRERLLLLCIERTSHGFGNGLMNVVPYQELVVSLTDAMILRATRLNLLNEENIARNMKGYEIFGVTGLSVNFFVNRQKMSINFKGEVAYPGRHKQPGYVITAVKPGSPAERSGFKVNDVIVGVAGRRFETAIEMDRHLGNAIETAEATGAVNLNIRRSDSEQDASKTFEDGQALLIALKMKRVGGFSATMPMNCPKSAAFAERLARYLAEDIKTDFGNQYFRNLSLLGLLSVGDPKYDRLVGEYILKLVPEMDTCPGTSCCTWTHTSGAIALCEYYLRTGDQRVKPGIEKLYKILAAGQLPYYGSGHKCHGGDYRSKGMNVTCGHVILCFALMKACGVDVDDDRLEKSLAFLRGATEHGTIRYAGVATYRNAGAAKLDYRYNGSKTGTAARSGPTAIAARLMGDHAYANALVRGIRHELGETKDRYKDFTKTHGCPLMGMFWGVLALSGGDEAALSEALKAHIWHFQINRQPGKDYIYMYRGGGSRYLSTIYLLAFNAHKHNLYVTGKSWWEKGYKVPLAQRLKP